METKDLTQGTEEQNREAFDDWYMKLVCEQQSALLRKVLHDNRKNLWTTWLELKPMWFKDSK